MAHFYSVSSLLDAILALDYFHGSEVAIPYHRVDGEDKLVVIVGDNASGKSFCRRIIQAMCQKAKVECIAISAEGRRKIAYSPWLTLVYGDEEYEATGVNSVGTVLQGINTCRARTSEHVIFWDEPDLGLSDAWARGVGKKFCAFAQDPPRHTSAAFIVSHRKALVRELLPANPSYLHLGVDGSLAPPTLQDWLDREPEPMDPEVLSKMSRARYSAIQQILNRVKP
jgi:hypothetical protein